MALIKFDQWRESSAHTRLRAEIAKGLRPVAGMGSLHGHSTAKPAEVKSIIKKVKKKVVKNPESPKIDSWLTELDGLEKSVQKLNDILSKKKKEFKSKVQKPEPNKSEPKDDEKADDKTKADKSIDKKDSDLKTPLAKEADKSKIIDKEKPDVKKAKSK